MPVESNKISTVTEVTRTIKQTLESSNPLRYVKVRGEISNLTRRASRWGSDFLYFTLKDSASQLSAVMFEGVDRLSFDPKDGDKVICEGMITVYEPTGRYQLKCSSLLPDGVGEGDAAVAFEALKKHLQAEGLFKQKRELPQYPKKIAVVTSPTGAALYDICDVIGRRYPITELCVIPAYVQGENAEASLIAGLRRAQTVGADLIIFGRGGGSAEDLACFNSEPLAWEIFASRIPTISAVGHEIDFTIADFVADQRAPTPSAAAELAVPNIAEVSRQLHMWQDQAHRAMLHALSNTQRELEIIGRDVRLRSPRGRIDQWENEVARLSEGISNSMHRRLSAAENALHSAAQTVSHLNPLGVLSRGYAVASKDGSVVRSAKELSEGDVIEIRFGEGSAKAKII